MTDRTNSPPLVVFDNAVVDLTERSSAFLLDSPRRPLTSVPHAAISASSRSNVARRRCSNEVVDLIDDNDSVEVMPRGLCIPSARRVRKMYKTDPNESPRRDRSTHPPQNTANLANEDVVEVTSVVLPPKPEFQILEVFPDADISAVQTLLNKSGGNVASVMDFMSENKYTKAEAGTNSSTNTAPTLNLALEANQEEWMYDYSSIDSFQPSIHYIAELSSVLLSKFPLSRGGSNCYSMKFKHRYTMCHNFFFDVIKGTGDEDSQYSRVLDFYKRKPLLPDQKKCIEDALPNCGNPTIKNPRKDKPYVVTEKVLLNEISYVDRKVQEWMQAQQARQDRSLKKFMSQRNGSAVECSCCFDSYPLDDMASCRDEGHLFCLQCLKSLTENLIFGSGNLGVDKRTKKLASELQCFHGDGCSSGFSREFLEKALPPKALKKYDEVQFEVSIKLSGLQSNICSCPKCGYQADVPDGQKLFECPVATCRFISCRDCGEAAHIPLRCEEVVKDKVLTEGRLTVEEAITAAKIRRCPSCKKGFIKESGCNKITCSCGNKVCYVCQESIEGYEHFCRTPHCTHKDGCKKCPLYTNAEEDDLRAMRQAGFTAAEQVKLAHVGKSDVQIDVNGILNAK